MTEYTVIDLRRKPKGYQHPKYTVPDHLAAAASFLTEHNRHKRFRPSEVLIVADEAKNFELLTVNEIMQGHSS